MPSLDPPSQTTKVIDERSVAGNCDHLVRLAAVVADKYSFLGSWRFAIAMGQGLSSTRSKARTDMVHGPRGGPYTDEMYVQTASASLDELEQHPSAVVKKLVGPLLRTLESAGAFPWLEE